MSRTYLGGMCVRTSTYCCLALCVWVSGLQAEPSTPAMMCSSAILGLCYSSLRSELPDGPSGLLGESPKLMVRDGDGLMGGSLR